MTWTLAERASINRPQLGLLAEKYYLSASEVMIHEEALYQVNVPLTFIGSARPVVG